MAHLDRSFSWLSVDSLPQPDLIISSNVNDIDLFVTLGSPATVKEYVVWIQNAVVGATSAGTAAFQTGSLPGGSSVRIIGIGSARIQGKGGAGGRGEIRNVSFLIAGGGGGGGAGTQGGAGGAANPQAAPGSAGTANAGGIGGVAGILVGGGTVTPSVVGGTGGTALDMSVNVTIQDLQVYGGGGGGGGGEAASGLFGGTGGTPGQAGDAGDSGIFGGGAAGGAAGVAVARNGNTLTQLGTNDIQGAIT